MTERSHAAPAPIFVDGPSWRQAALVRIADLDMKQLESLGDAFGLAWPASPNTSVENGDVIVSWLSPKEWIIVGQSAAATRHAALTALGDALHHVTDTSDGVVFFTIDGPWSRELLAKGCSLDLHPRAFPVHVCTQTLLAQCRVLIRRANGSNRFELAIDADLAGHLLAWLADAALEFNL